MKEIVRKILWRYGEIVTVSREGSNVAFRGVFQHTGSKDWQNMEKSISLLGQFPRGQYMVLAPEGVSLQPGDRLLVGNRRFSIRRAESVSWKEQAIYSWGLCVEMGGDDTWPV